MGTHLIARKKERALLKNLYESNESEFVAVYGRRRVGKTFLVRECFADKFSFQISALANSTTKEQLLNFCLALRQASGEDIPQAGNWLEAFSQLMTFMASRKESRKVIFFDELPWFDTPRSNFIAAFEHLWNGWASARHDILLIVCGSATSWIMDKLINNHGGLHNRLTCKIHLEPFTLGECEEFFKSRHADYSRYQIAQCYMVMGGIPYYLSMVDGTLSIAQNIDNLFFAKNGLFRDEFNNLYASLFRNANDYLKVVEALGTKGKGLSRDELSHFSGIPTSGILSKVLDDLESCGFIRSYRSFGKKTRNKLYQLTDPYTLFHIKFIKENKYNDEHFWTNSIDSPQNDAWSGYAFEMLCLNHIRDIKSALGISGVQTEVSSWRSHESENGAQVDLVIERKDQTINLCEMKFSAREYTITKDYEESLMRKKSDFMAETKTRKTIHLTMVTTFGVKPNIHSGCVQSEVLLDSLFE